MQAPQFFVHVNQAGGHAREATVALVGCVRDINSVCYSLEKALETAFCLALFGQFVERLFRLHDLFARLVRNVDAGRFGGDVPTKGDQIAAHGQIIDHLCIVTHGKSRDRSTGETCQIGGAAKLLQALVILHERLERHGAREVVLGDAGGGDLEDARVHGIIEMLRADDGGDAVVDVVIGEDRAQQLLFGLDRVGHGLGGLNGDAGGVE